MRRNLSILAAACTIVMPVAATAQATPPADQPAQSADETKTQTQTEQVAKATKADIKVGVAVSDADGNAVGKIESVDSEGAVVSTGSAQAKIPLSSFGRNDKGLVIAMTKAQLEAAAKEKTPK